MTILVAVLLCAALAAWWGARHARDAADYFAAGRGAGAWLVGIAGTAAALSAFTFVGGPGLFAVAGAGSLWLILSAPLTGALQCWAVGEPIVDHIERRPALTIPELLGARFGSDAVRTAAALVVTVGCVASLAVQVRAAAVLGDNFLGVPPATAAIVVMAATAAYTTLGGMRAGLYADAVQGIVMAVTAVVLAAAALAAAGGPAAAVETLERARPHLLGAFGPVPPQRAIAWYVLFCLGTCAQPHYLQKFLFLRGKDALRRLPAVLTLALVVTLTVWIGVGLGGAALVAGDRITIEQPDDLAPRTFALIGPWAMLLAGAGTLAAMMSTAASFLNLAAAALVRDLPASRGRAPGGLFAARVATAGVAVAATLAGLGSDRAVALFGIAGWGFFTAALLPVVLLGLHARPHAGAAVAAMLCGGAIVLALEPLRAHLPAGCEPGLLGAAAGVLILVSVPGRTTEPPHIET